LEKEVSGEYNTFKVYLLMLKVKRGSAREVQRSLGFSSTWLATHHLDKLEKLGLVRKDEHGDFLVVPRSFGILRFFVVTGRWVVPRMSFFAVMFGVMAAGFLFYLPEHSFFMIAFITSIVGLVVSLYETFRFYRLLPRT